MTTSYPGGLDAFPNPEASDKTDSPIVPHADQHKNANDAIEAIESELGTNPSGTLFTTVRERFEGIESDVFDLENTVFDISVIPDLSITQNKLAPDSVTNSKIADGAVTSGKLSIGSVDSGTIADDAVDKSKIASDVAGDGMTQNGDGSLSPEVDNLTIEIVGGSLRVKDGGIEQSDLTAALIQALVPTGTILMTGRTTAPSGYVLCDGSAVSRTGAYAALFTAIGTAYGTGNGISTFNLPNHTGRVPVGYDVGNSRFNAVGKTGGSETVTLTTSTLPSHTHSTDSQGNHQHVISINADGAAHTHTIYGIFNFCVQYTSFPGSTGFGFTQAFGAVSPYGDVGIVGCNNVTVGTASANHTHGASSSTTGTHTHTVTSSGSGEAHENMPPFLVHNYMIKL